MCVWCTGGGEERSVLWCIPLMMVCMEAPVKICVCGAQVAEKKGQCCGAFP